MKWLVRIFNKDKKDRKNQIISRQEQALFRIGREQFLKLKEKGLNIPVFTI